MYIYLYERYQTRDRHGLVGEPLSQYRVVTGSNPNRSKSENRFHNLGLCVLMQFFAQIPLRKSEFVFASLFSSQPTRIWGQKRQM